MVRFGEHEVVERALANGLRVVVVERPHLRAANASFFVRCGSRHEFDAELWGASHFVEHMVFRGTTTHPTSRKLARAFEALGAEVEASTWRDHTHFDTTVHPTRLEPTLALLAEMMTRPVFEGLDVERDVVEEELQSELDENGEDVDLNNLSRASVWGAHAMGRRITGSLESVAKLTVEALAAHHRRYYVASNCVLCVAGRVDAETVFAWAEGAFGSMAGGQHADDGALARFEPASSVAAFDAEGGQTSIALTFEAVPDPSSSFLALEFVSRVLDDGLGSRLHQRVCEEHGLAYDLSSGLDCYSDCGLYEIELKVVPKRAARAVEVTLATLVDLCERGISNYELECVRERRLDELEYLLDSAQSLAEHFGQAALFRRVESLAREAERFEAITLGELQRAADLVFRPERLHATVLGPLERSDLPRIESAVANFRREARVLLHPARRISRKRKQPMRELG